MHLPGHTRHITEPPPRPPLIDAYSVALAGTYAPHRRGHRRSRSCPPGSAVHPQNADSTGPTGRSRATLPHDHFTAGCAASARAVDPPARALSSAQAAEVGLSRSALSRRSGAGGLTWRRLLPRVYATFRHPLTFEQQCIAACLYCGVTTVVTGLSALRLRGFRYLPTQQRVHVVVAARVRVPSRDFVLVERSVRLPRLVVLQGVPTAAVPRAVVDACRRLSSYDDVLAVAAEAVQRRLATVQELSAELAAGAQWGTAVLRQVLIVVGDGVMSAAEGRALQLFRACGLPAPVVNRGLILPGSRVVCPDFRWGRLIVEIDSREWHLLVPGSWEATQQRRRALERQGFTVLVVTPAELTNDSDTVVADVLQRYRQVCGSAAAPA